jgi:transposase
VLVFLMTSPINKKIAKKRALRSEKKTAKAAKEKARKLARKELRSRPVLSQRAVALFEKRKNVVEAVLRKEPVPVVARVHGVPPRTVFRWLSWYHAKGLPGLRDDKRTGRPSKLSPEVLQWVYKTVSSGDPRQLKFEFALWTLNIVRMALLSFHNIDLSKSSISRLLAGLGLSPQVPVYKSYKQNPNKVRYYLKTNYPRQEKWAQENNAEIFFADESRVRADGQKGTTWAPIGETPTIKNSGERFGLNMISAVSASGAMHFNCFDGKMHSERFVQFLKDLRVTAQRSVLVIVDNGSYHKSKIVKEFLKTEGEDLGIKLVYLPPYSPELNPDEQVWNQAKRDIGRRVIKTKDELKQVVENALNRIKSTITLVKSFFRLPHTKYACASM